MGEAGMLGGSNVEGSAGWRRRTTSRGGMGAASSSYGASGVAGACGVGVLQLLRRDQANLVPILGKSTGWDYGGAGGTDKRGGCAALGNEWATIDGRWVTGNAASAARVVIPNLLRLFVNPFFDRLTPSPPPPPPFDT